MGSRERDDSEEADMESKDHHIDIVLPKSGEQEITKDNNINNCES